MAYAFIYMSIYMYTLTEIYIAHIYSQNIETHIYIYAYADVCIRVDR